MKRGSAALPEHRVEQIAEGLISDEERKRLVLVRRPGVQLDEEESGHPDGGARHTEAKRSPPELPIHF